MWPNDKGLSMQKLLIISCAVGVAALGGLLALKQMEPDECVGTAIAGGDIGGPFTLTSETGERVTDRDVITQPTLIYFGYSFCPDVCPIDAARNATTVDILAEKGINVGTAFITIDPARDTPEVLADYTDNFHPDMIGLTGSDEDIAATAKAYRVLYSRADDDPEYYLMNHSVFTYLVTPEDGFVNIFRREDSPEDMANRLTCYLG